MSQKCNMPLKSQRPPPPVSQSSITLRVDPHPGEDSAEQTGPPGGPHELARSRFARHSFTHRVGGRRLCWALQV